MPRIFGLIGRTLKHSFSQGYFTEKFKKEGIDDTSYELFELSSIDQFQSLIDRPFLEGLNVTIPYKQQVMPFLTALDRSAQKVGAVNVIKIFENNRIGYNSDYFGFKTSLEQWLPKDIINMKALVLGSGGASKAVMAVLEDLGIQYQVVSRNDHEEMITYQDLHNDPEHMQVSRLIINTTPLGMYPQIETFPDLPYELIGEDHYLYDLVYNPELTAFMKKGQQMGARVKNGLEMLHLQAEKSWEIWNEGR